MSGGLDRTIRVCIVDDDLFVTTSLATILDAESDMVVVGEGHNGDEAITLFEEKHPDVLLMDIQMPGMDGLSAAALILTTHPEARIVLLTTFSDDEYIVRALRLGARGYLVKQEVATIAPALRTVMTGQSVLGDEVLGRVDALMRKGPQGFFPADDSCPDQDQSSVSEVSAEQHVPRGGDLTEREHAVVELVAEGLDNREIAGKLFLSEGTVRNHISTILQKLALKNRTQLAIYYYRMR